MCLARITVGTERHPIIDDFIDCRNDLNGYGYFRGDLEAIQYAQEVSKNQERKWTRHGVVPKPLVKMLSRHFAVHGKDNPTYRDLSYGELLTLLMKGPYRNDAGRQVGEKLYRDLITGEMPWLRKSFPMQDQFYDGHERRQPSNHEKGCERTSSNGSDA